MSVRRIFVEKREAFAVKAKELREEIVNYLGIQTITGVRVLIRYDIENVSDAVYQEALATIFSEPPMDDVYEESFETAEGDLVFTVEYFPGQFDQRADSAEQCVKLLSEEEEPVIRSATTYVVSGTLTEAEKAAVKSLCINPVDSRENNNPKPETLVTVFEQPEDVKIFDGFMDMPEKELNELYSSLNLAMTFKDLRSCTARSVPSRHIHKAIKNLYIFGCSNTVASVSGFGLLFSLESTGLMQRDLTAAFSASVRVPDTTYVVAETDHRSLLLAEKLHALLGRIGSSTLPEERLYCKYQICLRCLEALLIHIIHGSYGKKS